MFTATSSTREPSEGVNWGDWKRNRMQRPLPAETEQSEVMQTESETQYLLCELERKDTLRREKKEEAESRWPLAALTKREHR